MDQKKHLVKKAVNGDSSAREKLVTHYYSDIFRFIYYRVSSQMDAEDITQKTFIQMIDKLEQLKDPDHFRQWLFRIAVNKTRDFHRKKKFMWFIGSSFEMDKHISFNGINDLPYEEALDLKEFEKKLRTLTRVLSKLEREIFLMRFLDQLTLNEISSILDKNVNTVKTHLYRAVKKFKKCPEILDFLKGK